MALLSGAGRTDLAHRAVQRNRIGAYLRRQRDVSPLEETVEQVGGFLRNTDDLVRGLPVELEVELGLGAAIVPLREGLQLLAPEGPLGEGRSPYGDADARRLPFDPHLPRRRPGRGDDAASDQALAALVLAREHVDRVAFCDKLAAVHRLLGFEFKSRGLRIAHLGLYRVRSHMLQWRNPLVPRKS